MSAYLRAFSERVADVPTYIKRNLALIRDLDEKVTALQKEIEMHSRKRLVGKGGEGGGGKRQKTSAEPAYDIDAAVTRLLSLADEKVTIAGQVYDYIDKHIQHLDEDLKQLTAELDTEKQQQAAGALPPRNRGGVAGPSAANGSKALLTSRGTRRSQAAAAAALPTEGGPGAGPPKGKGARVLGGRVRGRGPGSGLQMEPAPAGVEGMPPVVMVQEPGEHEPLYCFCQRPSHGSMVACDNEECPYEWFHYECVGLHEPPPSDTKWFCPECAGTRQ